ncbi:TetR/AcrR family transcriptional regulator [Bacillus sp. V59.32b]|uniref:TetR/AcrR family transcriptional regulator n=1 Tax=Bacillus sp. V59.32b TaxID=1758642 RepID=UPI000E3D49A0|nr:TetR/AcrR family transcriptional regulator [Bacillus sp. V59.32b]RFU68551.1 TetR/AcrR family transcriptional regulator [Bacillus sp. V59.32b]
MAETKIDPRIVRTRRLIMDAFVQLSIKKDFKDITIKDITTEATVNRATFYYHFTDKFDLLEKVLKEDLMTNVISEIAEHNELTESTIISVFLSVTTFQKSIATQCRRSFEAFSATFETIIKKELESIFYQMLLKRHSTENDESLRIASVMLCWGLYGASLDWQHNSTMLPEEYIKLAIPYVTQGMQFLASEGI